MTKFSSGIISYLIIGIIVFLLYGNTLLNGFVYDDSWLIVNNPLVGNLQNLPKIFTSCVSTFSTADQCKTGGVYYRPLLYINFLLINLITSKPWLFHLVNVALYYLTAVLTFKLFEVILNKKIYALFATVLFLVNPINSEVVNRVSVVNDLQLAVFFLLSFLSYIKFSKTRKIKFLILASFLYFLTVISKESGIFLFFIFLVYEFVFGPYRYKVRLKDYLPILVSFLIPIFAYLLIRTAIIGSPFVHLKGYHNMSFKTAFLTSVEIYPKYLVKLFYPLPLNAQHDPQFVNSLDFRFWISVPIWLFSFYLLRLTFKKRFNELFLGQVIIFIALIPALLLINSVGRFIFAERWLFLASLGWSLITVGFVQRVLENFSNRKKLTAERILIVLFCCYFIFSFYIVFRRNRDFHDELIFNKSIARLTQSNAGVWYNLGTNYSTIGQFDLAAEAQQKALEIDPNFWEAHNNLANAYLNLGKYGNAVGEYKKVLIINPQSNFAQKALGNLMVIKSGTESAKLNISGNRLIYTNSGLYFSQPIFWSIQEDSLKIIINDSEDLFTAEITRDTKPRNLTIDQYLNIQKPKGELVNEGLAKIPNFKESWVRIYKGSGDRQLLEFFMFEDGKVVKVLVNGANSESMRTFESILASIKLE